MYTRKHFLLPLIVVTALTVLLSVSAAAAERTVDPTTLFCFSQEDFLDTEADDGVFLTAVPSSTVADILYGERILRAGDALPRSALNSLTLNTSCINEHQTTIAYCTVADGMVTGVKNLKLSILPQKNEPPTAEDGQLETYRNIPNSGMLSASDPENSQLTYQIVKQPKRGTVEIQNDGTFLYTPEENKVGTDSFTFTVTDEAGNTSAPAKISITIKKPTDRAVYADMSGEPDAFCAMWMKDEGLYTGSVVGGNLCFGPDETVNRGEFLVMAMELVDAQADMKNVSSGFADEADTPVWMQPYITSALGSGMISGIRSDSGIMFRPNAELTCAEAAVILQNILQLPQSSTQPVFSVSEDADTMPVWAQEAASALSQAGIRMESSMASQPLTRRETAKLFYQIHCLLQRDELPAFYWVQ